MEKKQYKAPKIRPENSRAGLSYTVASIGFVGTKPSALAERGSCPCDPEIQKYKEIII
jgi:hypothetical protein